MRRIFGSVSNAEDPPAASRTPRNDRDSNGSSEDNNSGSSSSSTKKGGWFAGVTRGMTSSDSRSRVDAKIGNSNGSASSSSGASATNANGRNIWSSSRRSPQRERFPDIEDDGNMLERMDVREISPSSYGGPIVASTSHDSLSNVNERPLSTLSPLTTNAQRLSESRREKDALLIELLSGEAQVEVREFEIMDYNELEKVKKEHAILSTRVVSLKRSLGMESRLRDTAAKLVRISSPAATPPRSSSKATSSRPIVTKEQAEAQLMIADEKLAKLEKELHRETRLEAEMGTRLLKHTAGVLGLSIRKREQMEAGIRSSDSAEGLSTSRSRTNGLDHSLCSSSPATSPSVAHDRFEGHHFFSGNRDAITPVQRSIPKSRSSTSPLSSAPKPLEDPSRIRIEMTELREELSRTNAASLVSNGALQSELDDARSQSLSDQLELADLLSQHLSEQKATTLIRQGVLEARRTIEQLRDDMESATNAVERARLDNDQLREEVSNSQLSSEDMQLQISTGLRESERLQAVIDEAKISSDEADANGRNMVEERRKLVLSVGDVLRRHRTRPALGPALRDMRPFEDDNADRPDLAIYLSSSLDAYLEKVSQHLASVGEDRDKWKLSAESHRNEKESLDVSRQATEATLRTLQLSHSELQSISTAKEERLLTLDEVTRDLHLSNDETKRLGVELASLEAKCAGLLQESHTSKSINAAELVKKKEQIAILEERMQSSSLQEVDMLERLNEFTDQLEAARTSKRKVETDLATSAALAKTLQVDKSRLTSYLSASKKELFTLNTEIDRLKARPEVSDAASAIKDRLSEVESELEETKHSLSDVHEELAAAKARESKARGKLMEEIEEAQSEASSLRTQLRSANRKNGTAGTAKP